MYVASGRIKWAGGVAGRHSAIGLRKLTAERESRSVARTHTRNSVKASCVLGWTKKGRLKTPQFSKKGILSRP